MRIRLKLRGVSLVSGALLLAMLPGWLAVEAQEPRAKPLIGLKGEVASLILGGRPGGAFGISAVALPSLTKSGSAELWLEINGAELLAAASGEMQPSASLKLEIYAYAVDSKDQVPGYLAESFTIDLEPWGEFLLTTGVRFSGHLDGLEPGSYRLRVLVRLLGEPGASALRQLELLIPDDAEPRQALALSLPGSEEGWLRVTASAPRALTTASIPAALPLLYSGRSIGVELLTGGTHSSDTHSSDGATARLLAATDQEPRTVGEARLAWTAVVTRNKFGQVRQARIDLPPIAAGVYWLEIEFDNGTRTPRRQVMVLAGDLAQQASSWPLALRLATTVSSAMPRREATSGSGSSKPVPRQQRRYQKAYLEVLDSLASGASKLAAEQLSLLEQAATRQHQGHWGPLAAQLQEFHQRLARQHPESLPPILLLHLDQHARHARARRFPFAAANRQMITQLARLYATSSTSGQAPALAARALAGLGIYLQAASLWDPGGELLKEALTLDPECPSALLQLAIFHEAHGRYAAAVPYLRQLVASSAALEPRVRLALSLRRLGRQKRAEKLLRAVVDEFGHGNDPYLVIAYQELARLYLGSSRTDDAGSLLDAAIGRLPQASRLRLQRAFVFEQQGRSAESRALLATVSPAASTPSARFLYNRSWQQQARQPRHRLQRGAHARLAVLAAALTDETD